MCGQCMLAIFCLITPRSLNRMTMASIKVLSKVKILSRIDLSSLQVVPKCKQKGYARKVTLKVGCIKFA